MNQIRIIIYRKKCIYDYFIFSKNNLEKKNYSSIKPFIEECIKNEDCDNFKKKMCCLLLKKKGLSAYLVSKYIKTVDLSEIYKKCAFDFLLKHVQQIIWSKNIHCYPVTFIKLRSPKYQFIDFYWNERINILLMERQEIEHAMSWLSTLGGAFSALGDEFLNCAKVAGKISVKQFQLALRLGDPQLVARCKLYSALSLLQQGHLRIASNIIKDVFKLAKSWQDFRLQNMCKGVWAKLRYTKEQKKKYKT